MREAQIKRKTAETDIELSLNLDGIGKSECDTLCPFFDHMMTLFARHGRFDISLRCKGDIKVDYHHTVEDVAICLGQAFNKALGDKRGINRYGDALLPMDEALVLSAADISGRGGYYSDVSVPTEKVGDFDTELFKEFFTAFARESGITLHIRLLTGENSHHIIEGAFKSVARSLKTAVSIQEGYENEIPSTKGVL